MANFEEISEARRLLVLDETATLKEIKQAYKRMAFRHHPDTTSDGNDTQSEEIMKKLDKWKAKNFSIILMNFFSYL